MQLHKDKRILVMACIYSLSFFMLLLNYGGVYWDDWCIFSQNIFPNKLFVETGTWLINIPMQKVLLNIGNGVFINRITVFSFFLISAVLLLKSLDNLIGKNPHNLLITLLCAVIPMNIARVSLVCIFYTTSYLLYSTFFYIYTNPKKNLFLTILSYFCLFISFTTNSLLVFHFIVMSLVIFHRNSILNIKTLLPALKKNIIVLLLPIIFFVFKSLYLKPSGIYSGFYNKVSIAGLIKGLPAAITSCLKVFGNLIDLSQGSFFFVFILFLLISFILKNSEMPKPLSKKTNIKLAITGFLLLFGGVYPYAVVGKAVRGFSLNTRHELISTFGASLIIYAILIFFDRKLKHKVPHRYLISAILSVFVATNISAYTSYIKFWFENEAQVALYKKNPIIKNNTSFIGLNETFPPLNPEVVKSTAFYELTGIAKKAFGDTTRLISTKQESINSKPFPNGAIPKVIREREHYNVSDYIDHSYQYNLTVKQKRVIPTERLIEFMILNLSSNNTEKLYKIYEKYYQIKIDQITNSPKAINK